MIKTIALLFFLAHFLGAAAQSNSENNFGNHLQYELGATSLRSTHATFFTGGYAAAGYQLNKKWVFGVGASYVHCPFHDDNNWNLRDLNYFSAFVYQKLNLLHRHKFQLYGHLRQGISFANYSKEELLVAPGKPYHVSESGIYGYGGVGVRLPLNSKISATADIGIVSYVLSGYDLEVNPHGVNFMIGLVYNSGSKK